MENVNIRVPIPYRAAKWIWNIISIGAIICCVYMYSQTKPDQDKRLKAQKYLHESYRDSVEAKFDKLNIDIKKKEENISNIESELNKARGAVKATEKKLVGILDSLSYVAGLKNTLLNKDKIKLTDEEREIYLFKKFPNRDTNIDKR
tara:strand:+ start:484 stop:924 length:441 start_codon:yes stop_codon:yes gene_type:complete